MPLSVSMSVRGRQVVGRVDAEQRGEPMPRLLPQKPGAEERNQRKRPNSRNTALAPLPLEPNEQTESGSDQQILNHDKLR